MVNSRPDAEANPGGDTVQVRETRAALESLGATVSVRGPAQMQGLPPYDVAHVFNLQMPENAAGVFEALGPVGRPIVLSPVYWDLLPYWFESASRERARWRWPARLLGRERARRLYVRWQERKAPREAFWRLQRNLLNDACRILPNSGAEAELLRRTFALGPDFANRVDVVPNGISAALYEAIPRPSRHFVEQHRLEEFVLQVGTISPVKNQLGLIEALFDLRVPLVFIGHTPDRMAEYGRQCRRRAAERGDVIFIDHLSAADLPGIYALAAVHALPSWRETPGLVSLEAAASGCRIVTTSIGSARDYFGEHAWYCHPADVRSIRDAVRAALQAPRQTKLRDHVLANFTWRRAGETTIAAYERALQDRRN